MGTHLHGDSTAGVCWAKIDQPREQRGHVPGVFSIVIGSESLGCWNWEACVDSCSLRLQGWSWTWEEKAEFSQHQPGLQPVPPSAAVWSTCSSFGFRSPSHVPWWEMTITWMPTEVEGRKVLFLPQDILSLWGLLLIGLSSAPPTCPGP